MDTSLVHSVSSRWTFCPRGAVTLETDTTQKIREEVELLAGRFGSRRGTSDEEREASVVILDRFKQSSPFAYLEEFPTLESQFQLFSMYYVEFLIAAIIGIFMPPLAAAYGIFILILYIAEQNGIRLFSRLMPMARSQNVVAPFHADRARRTVIVTAGYDTMVNGVLSSILRSRNAHWLYRAVITCMIIAIGTHASATVGAFQDAPIPIVSMLKWMTAAALAGFALVFWAQDRISTDVRGANNNASGVAALYTLAERLKDEPLQSTDVWLVAVGNSYGSTEGTRRALDGVPSEKSSTFVVNLQGVGCGKLHYLTKEGLSQLHSAREPMLSTASSNAERYKIERGISRGLPTPAYTATVAGYPAVSVAGIDEETGQPPLAWSEEDRHHAIDPYSIQRTADYTYAMIRSLDS